MPPEESLLEMPEPTAFLTKTYEMVDDPAVDDVISWNDDGSAFVVRQTVEFARDLLPSNFNHSNFTSFLRQLYTYGFKKVSPDRWEFANELFRRGQKRLLHDIRRRRNSSAALTSAEERVFSSAELEEENGRLRREKAELTRELGRAKKVLHDVAVLVSTYSSGQQFAPADVGGRQRRETVFRGRGKYKAVRRPDRSEGNQGETEAVGSRPINRDWLVR